MDRVIVYDGALPQTTDILNANKFSLIGHAYQNSAMLGTSTVVAGLTCIPTSPTPDLHVTIGVGSIYQLDPTDASAYGDLGIDLNSIMKQGILAAPLTLTITPPGTGGFSQVYLVQAILNDIDAGLTVLSYYNSNNILVPLSGPANSGSSNFTTRTNPCQVSLKAGVPAATVTQSTPAPDAGFVGLYAITVANGATQITSGNIVTLTTAPFFPTLPGVPIGVRNGTWVWGTDTGTTNHFVVTVAPIPAAYVTGMAIRFKALNAVTGATDINLNGLGLVNVKKAGGPALVTGDIIASQIVELVYDGVNFQMVNYNGTVGAVTNNFSTVGISYVVDTGSTNAITANFSPSIGSYTAGLWVSVKLANAITGASTINANGLGIKNILLGDLTPTQPSMFITGEVLLLVYDGTQFQVYGTASNIYRKLQSNITLFVNGSTGSDTLYDGSASTITGSHGPFATISKATAVAWGYAPGLNSVTISIASGTYNENVLTPAWAGPPVVYDGGSYLNVTVNGGTTGSAMTIQGPNTVTINNISAQTNGAFPNHGFFATNGSTVITNGTRTFAVSYGFIAGNGATITPGGHIFANSCDACFYANPNGTVVLTGVSTVYGIAAPISVNVAFAYTVQGNIQVAVTTGTPTFTNPSFVSGLKFKAQLNGVIEGSGSLGVNYFPGTVAGILISGGQQFL